ncbi:MAG: IPT/TIG domain-containing protein [Nitrospirota bacterium]
MNITLTGRLALVVAVFAFAGYMNAQVSAEEPKIDKKKVVRTAAPVGQPGGGIQSTKASGASKVAKDRVCSSVTPKIKKVSPDEGRTGDKITLTGDNFGDAACISSVSFGPGSRAKFTQVNDGTVTTTVPEGKRGITLLSLTNSGGEDSKPFLRK